MKSLGLLSKLKLCGVPIAIRCRFELQRLVKKVFTYPILTPYDKNVSTFVPRHTDVEGQVWSQVPDHERGTVHGWVNNECIVGIPLYESFAVIVKEHSILCYHDVRPLVITPRTQRANIFATDGCDTLVSCHGFYVTINRHYAYCVVTHFDSFNKDC
jgi:hypothetical protein